MTMATVRPSPRSIRMSRTGLSGPRPTDGAGLGSCLDEDRDPDDRAARRQATTGPGRREPEIEHLAFVATDRSRLPGASIPRRVEP